MKQYTLAAMIALLLMSGCASPTAVPPRAETKFTGDYFNSNEVDVKVEIVRPVAPKYPEEFRDAGLKGYALVEFIVDAQGNPQQVQCGDASDKAFGQAGITAMAHWKFKPAEKAGKPVAVRMSQRLEFITYD